MTRATQQWIKENLTDKAPDGCGLKVGDIVHWTNDYGVKWTHKVIGFNTDRWYNKAYSKYVHLDTDCYWFPHAAETLTVCDPYCATGAA